MNPLWTRVATTSLIAALACVATAKDTPTKPAKAWRSSAEIIAASPAGDWRDVAPNDLIVMDLPQGQVLIELAKRFAPAHVANIRTLAHEAYYDGLAIIRVQDNYVTQWGDPNGDDAKLVKPLGTGAELYAIIGHAPRGLDLNITVVGRVLRGMEYLAALPRGGINMGFYDKPEQYHPITKVRLAADITAAERPRLEVLKDDSQTWAAVLNSRRFRGGWFVHSFGHTDVCTSSIPVRNKL